MIVNIHAAKTHLSKLIARAEAGEEVIIARAGKPRVKLAPIDPVVAPADKGSWLGSLRGQITFSPGWEEPDEEMIALMEEGEIFPQDDSGS